MSGWLFGKKSGHFRRSPLPAEVIAGVKAKKIKNKILILIEFVSEIAREKMRLFTGYYFSLPNWKALPSELPLKLRVLP